MLPRKQQNNLAHISIEVAMISLIVAGVDMLKSQNLFGLVLLGVGLILDRLKHTHVGYKR